MYDRESMWGLADQKTFDVLILGGGINGACLFDRLDREGYRVLIVDKHDFGSGTSQASGMMIWGGLLYLRNLDLATVFRLSRARDLMIQEMKENISARMYRYVPSNQGDITSARVRTALYFYWCLGLFRRKIPRKEKYFEDACMLNPDCHDGSLLYEEAVLNTSDCRFTLNWLTSVHSEESLALNYCNTVGEYSPSEHCWQIGLSDATGSKQISIRAKLIINCAGVWADKVNDTFHIKTPYCHALSKGVYVGIRRPADHRSLMIFEMGDHADVITFVPWGPVSLWGPTETFPRDIPDGMSVSPEDIRFLLSSANDHLRLPLDKSRIVSLRCGIRPLAVKKDGRHANYPLDLSRKQIVVPDDVRPWVSTYGGKITGCREMARKIGRVVAQKIPPACEPRHHTQEHRPTEVEWMAWPGMEEKVPSPRWCARNELCCTLEDYLRRRTNISQWIPRQGLGLRSEYRDQLVEAAMKITSCKNEEAQWMADRYEHDVKMKFDRVLAAS